MQSHPDEWDSFPPRADHAAPRAQPLMRGRGRRKAGGEPAGHAGCERVERWRRDPGVWPGLTSLPYPQASSPLSSEGTMRRYISGGPGGAEVWRCGGARPLALALSFFSFCPSFSHSLSPHPSTPPPSCLFPPPPSPSLRAAAAIITSDIPVS